MTTEQKTPDPFAPVRVTHLPTCPVAQPGFRLPTGPDGFVDTTKPSQCSCDFMKRLSEALGL